MKFYSLTSCQDSTVDVSFGPSSGTLTGYAINVSHGGPFLETGIPLPVEAPINLEFELPDSKTKIRCRGWVAWVNHPDTPLKSQFPPGMGIQFLDLTLHELETLRGFVKPNMLYAAFPRQ
jgi:uncharacterized protein (TIGR02266 family)